ncbi:MAG TPA: hypothetical protein VG273_10230 [Bryobacteraceae bacterium]|nr:hypothetical protein [Bryobacteraceae bacterium]
MRYLLTFFLPAFLLAAPAPDQSFRLDPGDFRWIPFTVRQTPASVTCSFEVLQGGATVHAELLPMSEFRLFDRGREHDTMAVTTNGRSGEFRRVIDRSGQYAVVIVNQQNARPVTVSLHVETNVSADSSAVALTLSPGRRFTVVLLGLGFFFMTAGWSSRKLIRAMRSR